MVMDTKDKGLQPIGTQSIVDITIQRIVDAIRDGKYELGQKLPNEYELISELQISRNSLREAMRVLSTIGIVEIKRGDGTYVCSEIKPSIVDNMIYGLVFDASSKTELVELRQSLDEIVLKLAIDKATDEDIEGLKKCIITMENSFKDGRLQAAAAADYDFHIRMVEASKNKFLERIVKGVYQLFRHSILKSVSTDEEHAHAVDYHTQILNTLINRDKTKVPDVIAMTLENWRHYVK